MAMLPHGHCTREGMSLLVLSAATRPRPHEPTTVRVQRTARLVSPPDERKRRMPDGRMDSCGARAEGEIANRGRCERQRKITEGGEVMVHRVTHPDGPSVQVHPGLPVRPARAVACPTARRSTCDGVGIE